VPKECLKRTERLKRFFKTRKKFKKKQKKKQQQQQQQQQKKKKTEKTENLKEHDWQQQKILQTEP
jgi:hypothetical protein